MRFIESLFDYLLQEPSRSLHGFVVFLAVISGVVILFFNVSGDFLLDKKWYLVLGGVPAILTLVFSMYLASYGKSELQIFNPGVYLVSLVVFLIAFGVAVIAEYLIVEFGRLAMSDSYNDKLFLVGMTILVLTFFYAARWFMRYGIFLIKIFKNRERQYIGVVFYIKQNAKLSIYVTKMEFVNSSTGTIVTIDPDKFDYSKKDSNEPILNVRLLLSKGTDLFKLSWYSFTENKYFTDDFPFLLYRYELIPDYVRIYEITNVLIDQKFINRYAFLMPKRIKSLTLTMKEDGDLDLHQVDNSHYFFYKKVITEDRSASEFNDSEIIYKARLARSGYENQQK